MAEKKEEKIYIQKDHLEGKLIVDGSQVPQPFNVAKEILARKNMTLTTPHELFYAVLKKLNGSKDELAQYDFQGKWVDLAINFDYKNKKIHFAVKPENIIFKDNHYELNGENILAEQIYSFKISTSIPLIYRSTAEDQKDENGDIKTSLMIPRLPYCISNFPNSKDISETIFGISKTSMDNIGGMIVMPTKTNTWLPTYSASGTNIVLKAADQDFTEQKFYGIKK